MIAIVTSRSFLLCESVNNMFLESEFDQWDKEAKHYYRIVIDFEPVARSNQSSNMSMSNSGRTEVKNIVSMRIIGEKPALALFKELVIQVREQCPDQPYLDKMIERILSGEMGEIHDDAQPTKTSPTRKKKRTSKKVLRRAK